MIEEFVVKTKSSGPISNRNWGEVLCRSWNYDLRNMKWLLVTNPWANCTNPLLLSSEHHQKCQISGVRKCRTWKYEKYCEKLNKSIESCDQKRSGKSVVPIEWLYLSTLWVKWSAPKAKSLPETSTYPIFINFSQCMTKWKLWKAAKKNLHVLRVL